MSGARAPPRFKRLCAMLFKGPKNSVPSKIVGHEPHQRNCTLPSPPLFLILYARGRREAARPRYSYTAPCIHFAKRFFLFFFFPSSFSREKTRPLKVSAKPSSGMVCPLVSTLANLPPFLLRSRLTRQTLKLQNVTLPGVQASVQSDAPASLLTNSFPSKYSLRFPFLFSKGTGSLYTLLSNVSPLYILDNKNFFQEKRKKSSSFFRFISKDHGRKECPTWAN